MSATTPAPAPRGGAASAADSDYARYARPLLMRILEACRLDAVYHRAQGDVLWTRDAAGAEVEVLDMAGGYGVGLLGHHHPAVTGALRAALDEQAPFHAQGSHRLAAGALCRRLSDLVGAETGRRYVVTLASTGTEAVEAAIKHAELERDRKVQGVLDGHREHHRAIQGQLRNRQCDVVPRVLAEVGERLGMPPGSEPDLEEVFHQVLVHNTRLAEQPPIYLALEGAFHGKTTGSLKLTWSPEARRPFRRLGVDVTFLPRGDVAALAARVREARQTYLDLAISEDGDVRLHERPVSRVAALLVEPIQGEGGIREVGAEWLQAAQRLANEAGFPLVLDEIQSGCGRTGTFLASEQDGVIGDYYVLSKALGGGLAKVSALLVDSARYREEFGVLHTSTFAEDDLSSRVALAALDVITADAGAVMGRARRQGARLLEGLRALQARFPRQVVDVRGRGLMVGLELARREDAESPTLRQLASQGLLGFVVAGFLLNEERVRVLPTLSRAETLRIQPSAFVSDAQVDRFLAAIERACALLEHDRGDRLIRYLCADARGTIPRPARVGAASGTGPIVRAPTRPERATTVPPYAGRVSFLAHFIRAGHLRHWDPGLRDLDDAALERYLDRTHRLLEPFVSETAIVESAIGERVHLSLIGVPVTPAQIQRAFDEGSVRWVEDKVMAGVRLARRQGSSIVGLGGYTSIITGQGTRLSEDRVGITSGNAMTVAAGVEALMATAQEAGIDLARACLGALGATGNICSLYAQMMAERVPRLVLIGRPHMESRLRRVAGEVYFETYKLLRREGERPPTGLGGVLLPTETYRRVRAAEHDLERIGVAIFEGLERELGAEAPVQVCTDPAGLRGCDLIVSASSTPDPVIFPQHLGPGPRVICDLAVPEDTAPEVLRERPDVRVIRGGVVRLPREQGLVLAGLPLEPDHVFACMAETLLLGLSRMNEHFSWGRVTKMHVEAIRDLARYHGFTLSRPSMESPL